MNIKLERLCHEKVNKLHRSFHWSRHCEEDTGFVHWRLAKIVNGELAVVTIACRVYEDRWMIARRLKRARWQLKQYVKEMQLSGVHDRGRYL